MKKSNITQVSAANDLNPDFGQHTASCKKLAIDNRNSGQSNLCKGHDDSHGKHYIEKQMVEVEVTYAASDVEMVDVSDVASYIAGNNNNNNNDNNIAGARVASQQSCTTKIIKNPSNENVQAFFDIEIGNQPVGRLVMNMFYNIVPKTCHNFVRLCTHAQGFGYKGTKFHHVNSDDGTCAAGGGAGGWIGGQSIYGKNFPCENFVKKHDEKGIVTMWNINGTGFVSSIFMFSVNVEAPLGWDDYNVAFAKVTDETYYVAEDIMKEKRKGLFGWTTLRDIVVVNCGIL